MILAPTASVIVNSTFKDILFDSKLIWFSDADWYQRLFRAVLKNKRLKVKFLIFLGYIHFKLEIALLVN